MIPTEPIGSIPCPPALIAAIEHLGHEHPELEPLHADTHLQTARRYASAALKQAVSERVVEAAELIPLAQLGTTDDCGFAPFCDDRSTSRDIAFAKIAARVHGTAPASQMLGT